MTPCRVCTANSSGFICRPCLAELERALGDFTSLMHETSILATRQARVYRANGQPQPDIDLAEWDTEQAALPAMLRSRDGHSALTATRGMVNLGARDLLAEAVNTIAGWARHLHERSGIAWFDGDTTRPVTTADALAWLLTNIDTIRWDEAAEQIHTDVTRLRGRMLRAVDRVPSRVFAGPCETTQPDGTICRRSLYAWPAKKRYDTDAEAGDPILCDGYRPPFERSDEPRDHGCGAAHLREDRRTWLLADIEDRLLPMSLLQDVLPGLMPEIVWPTRSTWWRWRKLLPVKTLIEDVEFYRGGDVIDLCLREQQRIRGNNDRAKRGRLSA